MIYTHSEQTQKNYTVAEAIAAAKHTLRERHNINQICLDLIEKSGKNPDTPITLKELNDLSYQIVDMSLIKLWT